MGDDGATVPKIVGIETEYGIMLVGDDAADPFLASDLLLSVYPLIERAAVPTAGSFAPGEQREELPPSQDVRAFPALTTDFMLGNGARLYIDHAHPEYSTPECISPRQLVAADKAGEQVLAACMQEANRLAPLSPDRSILVYKNNGDYKDNSYGCHENYLLSQRLFTDLVQRPLHRLFRAFLPFFVTRTIVCGAGKVGGENGTAPVGFQLSQRADFFEELIGLQTTRQRPLFNLRDEPHADPARYRRLHVILADANMAEYSTYLKVGTAQLVLRMLEDDFFSPDLTLRDPLAALRIVSRDLSFLKPLQLEAGSRMTALEIQQVYLEQARLYLEQQGGSEEDWQVWKAWAQVLAALPRDLEKLSLRLDWAIKLRVFNHYLETYGGDWDRLARWQPVIEAAARNPAFARELAGPSGLNWKDYEREHELYFALRRLDLEYHDIRQDAGRDEVGLFYRLQQHGAIERVVTDQEITRMLVGPPEQTRAWLRGHCIQRFGRAVHSADWEYLCLSQDQETPTLVLRMDDPALDTAATWRSDRARLQSIESFLQHCHTLSNGQGRT